MSSNTNLNKANRAKMDEFYTRLPDIEDELRHYRKHFKDKAVLCNCDDPFESNFFKYFVLNFNRLGLRKLIATCYTNSPIAGQQLSLFDVIPDAEVNTPYKAIVTTVYDKTGDGGVDMLDIAELFKSGENELCQLEGDGDFRSQECLALMDEADIVVTNPPFSLFREYVATLIKRGKGFIIVGNKNALKYKEIFPLIRENKLWVGMMPMSREFYFDVPEDYARQLVEEKRDRSIVMHDGRLVARAGAIWYTNLDIKKRHEEMIFIRRFSPERYPRYVNFDGIEVAKVCDIPSDYDGLMGVPITFMDKYNPDQFEIVGYSLDLATPIAECAPEGSTYTKGGNSFYLDEGNGNLRRLYDRIVIRNRNPEKPR